MFLFPTLLSDILMAHLPSWGHQLLHTRSLLVENQWTHNLLTPLPHSSFLAPLLGQIPTPCIRLRSALGGSQTKRCTYLPLGFGVRENHSRSHLRMITRLDMKQSLKKCPSLPLSTLSFGKRETPAFSRTLAWQAFCIKVNSHLLGHVVTFLEVLE